MPGLRIRHAVLVRAPPEKIWQALTTAEGLDGWFTTGAEVDPGPGGSIRFRWRDWGPEKITTEDGGPVLEADPPRRFVFGWHEDLDGDGTRVEFTLKEVDEGTIVRVIDEGYPDSLEGLELFMDCAAGWGEALTLLKFYVEHGVSY